MNNDDLVSGARRESPLDAAIDRAVRQMMQVDPPAGLRHRVMARLEPIQSRRAGFFPGLAFAAAALAMLLLAVVIMRREVAPPVPAPGAQAAVTAREASSAATAEPPRAAPIAPPSHPARRAPGSARGLHSEIIRMPTIGNVFGSRAPRVAAADASALLPDTVFPSASAAPAVPGPAHAEDAGGITPLPAIPAITIPPLQIEGLRVEPVSIRR